MHALTRRGWHCAHCQRRLFPILVCVCAVPAVPRRVVRVPATIAAPGATSAQGPPAKDGRPGRSRQGAAHNDTTHHTPCVARAYRGHAQARVLAQAQVAATARAKADRLASEDAKPKRGRMQLSTPPRGRVGSSGVASRGSAVLSPRTVSPLRTPERVRAADSPSSRYVQLSVSSASCCCGHTLMRHANMRRPRIDSPVSQRSSQHRHSPRHPPSIASGAPPSTRSARSARSGSSRGSRPRTWCHVCRPGTNVGLFAYQPAMCMACCVLVRVRGPRPCHASPGASDASARRGTQTAEGGTEAPPRRGRPQGTDDHLRCPSPPLTRRCFPRPRKTACSRRLKQRLPHSLLQRSRRGAVHTGGIAGLCYEQPDTHRGRSRQEREAAQRRREARERAIRNRKRAETHYRLHLLLYYGMSPWQDYMYLLRLRMKKALLHYRQTVRYRCPCAAIATRTDVHIGPSLCHSSSNGASMPCL